jgi:uncharacterized protein YidB (DUF937 family)
LTLLVGTFYDGLAVVQGIIIINIFLPQVRVFSAFIKDIEDPPAPGPWGSKSSLGTLLAEFANAGAGGGVGGWVHSVSFSGDGGKVAWVAHDSSISVADACKPGSQSPGTFINIIIW